MFRFVWVFWVNFGLSEFDHLIIRSFTQIPGGERRTEERRMKGTATARWNIYKKEIFFMRACSVFWRNNY